MQLKGRARSRLGYCPSPVVGLASFTDPEDMGSHRYGHSLQEKNGIVYTSEAGHIDIGHVRKTADWTAYLSELTYAQLQQGRSTFSFKQREPSRYFVTLQYPEYWDDLPQEEREFLNREVAITLGQYFAFLGGTWHEIVTWFGYKSSGVISEFPSAFSWEDTFSNLLGTRVARTALHDTEHTYNDAVTLALDRELNTLGIQSKQTALEVTRRLKRVWYSGNVMFFIRIKKRNLDIGLGDGLVTPSLAATPQAAAPRAYPVPNLDLIEKLGFAIKLEIEPRERIKRRILRIVRPDSAQRKDRIEPAVDLAPIMSHIHREALTHYGYNVDMTRTIQPDEAVYISQASAHSEEGG